MRTIRFVILTFVFFNVLPLHAQITAIVVEGNVRTKEAVIERELGFTAGQSLVYSDSMLGVWRMRLESTKLFNWVEITRSSSDTPKYSRCGAMVYLGKAGRGIFGSKF